MTTSEFRALLEKLADAWSRRDYATAAGAFAADVSYADPLRYSFASRQALQRFFEADDGREQITVWHTILFDEDQQTGVGEYTYDGTQRYHGIALVRVRDDVIAQWREYQHVDPRDFETFTGVRAWRRTPQ